MTIQSIDISLRNTYIRDHFNITISHKQQRTKCPKCGTKDALGIDTANNKFPYNCFSCGEGGNIFTTENLGLPKYTDKFYNSENGTSETDKLISQYKKLTSKNHRLKPRLLDHFNIKPHEFKAKSTGKKYKTLSIMGDDNKPIKTLMKEKWIGLDARLRSNQLWYGQNKIKSSDKRIYVTAGEWDLFSFYENTSIDAIGWPNGESPRPWKADELSIFGQNKQIIILYDNDKVGREGAVSLASSIQRHIKTDYIKIIDFASLGLFGGQDLDDFFMKGGSKEKLLQEIDDTKPINISLSTFDEVDTNPIRLPPGDYYYEGDTLKRIWNISKLTEARREYELEKIAHYLTGQTAGRDFNKQVKKIKSELDSLRLQASLMLTREFFKDKNIVKRKSNLGDQGYNLLHYDIGVYKLCTDNFWEMVADDILSKIFPDDKIRNRKSDREAIYEEVRILTNYQDEKIFDINNNYINFMNGLYYKNKGKFINHSPHLYVTFQIKVNFPKDKTPDLEKCCPNFMQALLDWFTSPERREFIKTFYYFMTGDRSKELAILFRGPGNDGKSKAIEIFKALAGHDSTSAISLNELHGHTLASLDGSFLNIIEDASDSRFDSGAFKKIVSSGLTQINQKNKPVYSIEPRALFLIASNFPIKNNDTSRGFSRRWKMVFFKQIKRIIYDFFNKKLKHELEEIAYYCLKMGEQYFAEDGGFISTELELEEKGEMKQNSSPDAYFMYIMKSYEEMNIDRRMIKDTIFDIFEGDFIDIVDERHYKDYGEFCDKGGVKPASHKRYSQQAERFFNEKINEWLDDTQATIKRHRKRIIDDFGSHERQTVLKVEISDGTELDDIVHDKLNMPF